ncbi:MAG: tetratricopeptide repeat protein [Bacteroidota bacterium]
MRLISYSCVELAGKYCIFIISIFCTTTLVAQKSKADSLQKLLLTVKDDTSRVRLTWQMAEVISNYKPDSAFDIAQKALSISKDIKYIEGQSRSLGIMANAFFKMGNYPDALKLYFEKLRLDEKRDIPRNLASVLMNIGVVYTMQEEYTNGLKYYYMADSVIQKNNVAEMKYFILLNLGDAYDRMDIADSSYRYFSQSLDLARKEHDADFIATSMTGLGHSYLKKNNYQEALNNYLGAIAGLRETNDDEILCEAELGLASLYEQLNKKDSATYFAKQSLIIARKGDFLSHELEAAVFLTNHYKNNKNTDSAFVYVNHVQDLNNAIYSKQKIRELQILSSNEQLRQLEIEENKKIAAKERHQQLQLLFIGIFIPGFFIFTLLLSRIKIHTRIIRALGVLSLLISFEYLTLLLHPYVLAFTGHAPIFEILIFVAIAAIIIPAHHRIEHWLMEKLTGNKNNQPDTSIRLTTRKIKMKDPSN